MKHGRIGPVLGVAALLMGGVVAGDFIGSASTLAQELQSKSPPPSIRVTGEASVSAKPDQAMINVGVVTEATTAQSAASLNASRMEKVVSELRQMLGAGAEIKTTSYSVTPVYRRDKEGNTSTISGFTATNVVQIKVSDFSAVGRVIDLSTQLGANSIPRIQFTLKDEQAVRMQALREAATKAKAEAETIASALGLKIIRVLSVEAGGSHVRPVFAMGMETRAMAAPQTPVEPGTIEVSATVTLSVEVSQ
jgi:uncharacterized protein YggE